MNDNDYEREEYIDPPIYGMCSEDFYALSEEEQEAVRKGYEIEQTEELLNIYYR